MAVRTVTVRLRADISQYTRGMQQASTRTAALGNAGAALGAGMVAAFAVAAASAAKFDKALSGVRAVSGATTAEMKQLRAAALDAGKTTSFTATEAADAEAELARAGVSVANITGGALKGALALAASGQVEVSEAAVTAAQAMNTFGLEGRDVTHIADLLAAGANKTAADVHGLGMAMRMGGLLAHQTGLSIEDTVGTLAAFADHALIGSDAGTSLKTMLQRLVPQSKEAQSAMDAIGFSAYDASGEFVGLSELAGRMKTSFSKLTPEARNSAMATIFGSDAVRSATIMYELGSEGIDKYVKSVDDSGAAQRMAAVQTDNLIGDVERLKGALEVALIEGGSAANDSLRSMTQMVTGLVNAYTGLPPELQHAVTGFLGIGGAATLVGGAMLLMLPRIAATRAALVTMGVTAQTVRAAMMSLGRLTLVIGGMAAVSYGVRAMVRAFDEAPPNVTKLTNSLVNLALQGKASGELTRTFGDDLDKFGFSVARIAHAGVLDKVGDSLYTITHLGGDSYELEKSRENVKSLDDALAQLVQGGSPDIAATAFQRMAKEAESQGTSTEKLRTLLPQYSDALSGLDTQQKLAADSQAGLGDAASMTADEMADERTEAEKLTDALKSLNGMAISTAEQEISFRQSLHDLTDAVKENGRSLDVTTEKGRAVKGAFLDAAKSAMEYAQSVAEQTGSQEKGQATLEKNIGLLRDQMSAAGFGKDAIDELTRSYLQLPVSHTTVVKTDKTSAVKDLQHVQAEIRKTKGKPIVMSTISAPAEKVLRQLGYTVTHMPDGSVTVSVPTGPPLASVGAIQRAINGIQGKPVGIGVYLKATASDSDANGVPDMIQARAQGGIVRRAGGGAVQYYPQGGEVFGPGTGTSDSIPALISNGEYVIKAASVQKYGVAMFDRLNAGRFASGGLAGFSYTPTGQAVLGGPSDAKSRYDKEVEDLRQAWADLNTALAEAKKNANAVTDAEKNLAKVRQGKHTAKQLDAAEDKLAKARSTAKASNAKVAKERKDLYAADAALGVGKGAKVPTSFSLAAYQKQLTASLAATTRWRTSLTKIGQRGGAELKAMLEGMGEDGYALVNALAGASTKQFNDIVKKLTATGDLAKATLADFTTQLGANTKEAQQFASDLQTLAARGFGELAQALAGQGDASAQALARGAVTGSAADVARAQAAVKAATGTLSGEDLEDALTLLTTLRGGTGRGFSDLIAAGLDTATIRALVPRMMAQINSLPAANKGEFLRQFAAQGGVTAMARGGILSGPGLVLGGEAGVPESWIPHDGSARSRALLATTARALGYDARPANRWGTAGGSGPATTYDQRQTHVTLQGAKQTAGEQAADIARHLTFIG
ncbi:phage tail tape measure protein [Streptomyces sp. NPDC060198]|uniref:phage tail tape measure protein n=1 Tax=Streptomyces sp. NPDC060198 TaxID=3347070 RepID=UPI003651BBF1